MKSRVVFPAIVCLCLLAPGNVFGVEDAFVVELNTVKNVVGPREPVHVQFMVKNLGDNDLPLFIQHDHYTQPLVTYRLWIKSVSNDLVDEATYGPLTPDFGTVTSHSDVSIWTFDVRQIFSRLLPSRLSPGLYRVSVDGTWEGITPYWAETYFLVEAHSTKLTTT